MQAQKKSVPFFELLEPYIVANESFHCNSLYRNSFIDEVAKRLLSVAKYELISRYNIEKYFVTSNIFFSEGIYMLCMNQLIANPIESYLSHEVTEIFGKVLLNTSNYFFEIIINFKTDLINIVSLFEINEFISVKEISFLGDAHEMGKSVALVHFSDGSKLIYRPNVNNSYRILSSLLEGFSNYIALPNILACKDHSWIEYIEDDIIFSKEKYSFAGGILCAFSQILGIDDLHFENIKFSRGKFYLLDIETAFCLNHSYSDKFVTLNGVQTPLIFTPLFTSLLPIWSLGIHGGFADFSGLVGPAKINYGELTYLSPGLDDIFLKIQQTNKKSVIQIGTDDLMDGYYHAINSLGSIMDAKFAYDERIANLQTIQRRVTIRSTIEYYGIMQLFFSQLSNRIKKGGLHELLNQRQVLSREIFEAEYDAILQNDIPLFREDVNVRLWKHDSYDRLNFAQSNLPLMKEIVNKCFESQQWSYEKIQQVLEEPIYSL